MKKKKSNLSIARKVAYKIFIILFFMCVCLSLGIQNAFHRELSLVETKYMTEVIARISTEVNRELDHYIDVAVATAQSQTIKEYLLSVEQGDYGEREEETVLPPEEVLSEDVSQAENLQENADENLDETLEEQSNPEENLVIETDVLPATVESKFQKIQGYEIALAEIEGIADMLGSSVLYVVLCSIHEDDFFNSSGQEGGEGFSLTTRPFYEAYTTKKTYITDPYEEVLTGKTIITVAEPVFDETGRVMGLILIQLSLDEIGNIVTSSTFGESGASMLMDRNNIIIAYNNPAVLGMDAGQLEYTGDQALQELTNPTGAVIEYDFAGNLRTGAIVTISELSGWKMLLGMDASEFKQNISTVALRLNSALVLAVLICSMFCAKAVYTSLKPLKKLEDFMEELAEGNLAATVEYDEPDEIGRLATHMNKTVEALNFYVDIIDSALIKIGGGDFTRPTDTKFKGDFKKFEVSLDRLTNEMSTSIREVKLAVEQMNIGSSQVATGSQLLSDGSAEQNNSIENLHHLIQDIDSAIVITAKNSSNVTSDAENISKNLVGSNAKMQELVVSVQDIRLLSDEVKRIIKSIEDVAFQTNILSLNASIEAARAGTAGRGFAVVADQVRMLSTSTAEAAEQTTKIINDIADAIETGTGLAQTTSKELQGVVDEVDIFVENISNISLSTQNQASAISEINQSISDISNVVLQNSAISEESAASSEQLSAQADQMLEYVKHYKLIDRMNPYYGLENTK